jgi:regulatory protein
LRYAQAVPAIAKLVPRRRQQWVEVVPAEGDSLRLPVEHCPAWVKEGAQVDEGQWRKLAASSRFWLLYDKAVRILGRREHFRVELRRKLSQREPDRQLVGSVMQQCERQGYLDDGRAARITIEQLTARGGMGRARLRHELHKRGCPAELVAPAVEAAYVEVDEAGELELLLARRRKSVESAARTGLARLERKQLPAGRLRYELRGKLLASLQRFLAGRGFAGGEAGTKARALVDEVVEELLG